MNIRRGLQMFGTLGLAKSWNEEDHPRDDDGKFSSTGGGGGSHDDDGEEYEPGEGYEPKDQARHDKAMAALGEHISGLESSLNSVAAAVHSPDASPDKIIAAGKDAIKQFKEAGRAYDKVQAIREKYGDAAPDAGILRAPNRTARSGLLGVGVVWLARFFPTTSGLRSPRFCRRTRLA
ncbi:hypothetical protein FF100_29425, partial [Methylobacterium terricola]